MLVPVAIQFLVLLLDPPHRPTVTFMVKVQPKIMGSRDG
jgi:hypothetical protein